MVRFFSQSKNHKFKDMNKIEELKKEFQTLKSCLDIFKNADTVNYIKERLCEIKTTIKILKSYDKN